MDPIEIRIRITVSKEGDIYVTSSGSPYQPGTPEPNPESVPDFHVVTPTYLFECKRWFAKVGKKEAESCRGCTIQCHMKGRYNGEKPYEHKVGL